MGLRSRAFLAGSLGFAAAFAVACDSSNGLLSADQATTLSTRLDAVSQAVSSGDCGAVSSAVTSFVNAVGTLRAVNDKLLRTLGDGSGTVRRLAAQDCSSSASSTSTSKSASTTTSPSTSTTTTTTTTTTSTSTPNSSTAPPTTSSTSGTATNPPPPGTSTTSNGGVPLGGGGTGTTGNGGNGQ